MMTPAEEIQRRVALLLLGRWTSFPEERKKVLPREVREWREFFQAQGWLADDRSWELSSKGRAALAANALEGPLQVFASATFVNDPVMATIYADDKDEL